MKEVQFEVIPVLLLHVIENNFHTGTAAVGMKEFASLTNALVKATTALTHAVTGSQSWGKKAVLGVAPVLDRRLCPYSCATLNCIHIDNYQHTLA
jgi:hypothetical protein